MISKRKLSLLFILGTLALMFTACEQQPRSGSVGAPAPDFILKDMKGKTWTLSELKGQVVFVNFWATWCPPCRDEMPSMQRLYDKMPKDKFKMLAILNRDSRANADTFTKKLGITMPILDDQANNIGQLYGLTGLPETFIVDKQGVMREKFIGPARWDSPEFIQMMMRYINE